MTDFDKYGYVIIKEFLDPVSIRTVSRYMEYRLKQSGSVSNDPTSKYSFYADPLVETILYNATPDVEQACGLELHPTYSYSRVYVKGEQLKKHVDRPSCEISVTCNVAINGNPWSIWCQYLDNEPTECILNPGDAVVYKGCEVEHWRYPLEHADFNAQFMLHYVNKNGPYAEYKWDKRSSLGSSSNTRRQ